MTDDSAYGINQVPCRQTGDLPYGTCISGLVVGAAEKTLG